MDLNQELEELKSKVTPMSTSKFIFKTLISLGATAAVVGLFKGPLEASKGVTKLMMKLGIFVLGCKAGEIAEEYFGETFDETLQTIRETREELKSE